MFSMECKGIHHVIGTENIAKISARTFKYRCKRFPVLQSVPVNVIQAETSSTLPRYNNEIDFL